MICGLVIAVLVLQIGLGGFPVTVERQGRAAAAASLYIGFLQTIDSLNPYIGINDASYLLYGLIYDYPYAFDQDGNFIPNIVTSSSCAVADCSVWNYTVRQGVYWSDGTQLTASDVAFTWNYDSQNLFHLWAYEPYFNQVVVCTGGNKKVCGAQLSTVPWNVTVYFQRPFAAGEDLFAPIVQQAQWGSVAPNVAGTSYANTNPIGTGPFIADANIYQQYLQNGQVPFHLYKNTRYHPVGSHVGPVNISDIYLRIYQDPSSLVLGLENGDIQLAQMTSAGVSTVQGLPGILTQSTLQAIQEWDEIGVSQLDTASANGRLNPARFDINVRQAMAKATNKDYILQTFYLGSGRRGDTLVSPITPQWWYDPVAGGDNLTFDIAAANAILDAKGWTGTWSDASGTYRMNTNPITVSYQTACYQCVTPANVTKTIPAGTHLTFTLATRPQSGWPEEVSTASYLVQQYKQIGIKINVKQETTEDALSTDVYNGYTELYIWYWSADPDPNYILSMESSWTLDGWNDNYWNNATYNALYLSQLSATDLATRQADVKAAQKLFYDSAVYIIYIYPNGNWAMRTDQVRTGQQWTGWGDWTAHPYRQMNAYWGANPLWFDLNCVTCGVAPVNVPPTPPVITGSSPISTRTGVNLSFSAQTSDSDIPPDSLNWTWSWGDGNSTTTGNTTAATSTYGHIWTVPGNYTVYVSVSDGHNPPVVSSNQILVNVTVPPPNPGSIQGTVTSASGAPISGARLIATPGNFAATSSGTGTYTITGLAAGTYDVSATAPGYVTSVKTGQVVLANAATTVDFTLEPNLGWVVGTVTNSQGGAPIGGVQILATVSDPGATFGHQRSTSTDVNGHYNISLEPGNYWVNASLGGYGSQSTPNVNVTTRHEASVSFSLTSTIVETPKGIDPLVIGVIALVVVVVVAALVALMMMRRRKKKETEESKIELPPKAP